LLPGSQSTRDADHWVIAESMLLAKSPSSVAVGLIVVQVQTVRDESPCRFRNDSGHSASTRFQITGTDKQDPPRLPTPPKCSVAERAGQREVDAHNYWQAAHASQVLADRVDILLIAMNDLNLVLFHKSSQSPKRPEERPRPGLARQRQIDLIRRHRVFDGP